MTPTPARRGFTRMETDHELVARIRAKAGAGAHRLMNQSVDDWAAVHGLARRIVEGEP